MPFRLLRAFVLVGLAVLPIAAAAPSGAPLAAAAKPMPELGRLASPILGASYLRMLGPHALPMLAPGSDTLGALVALPRGSRAEDLGLEPSSPGIGRLRATPERILAFADAHPGVQIEVAPPLH